MHYDKYNYRTPQKPMSPEALPRSPPKEHLGSRPQSPRYKPTPRPPMRDNYFTQDIQENQSSPKRQSMKSHEFSSFQPKLKTLIFETLSSADRVAQQLLHNGEPESQPICSSYFLNREKLYSYISNEKSNLWDRRSAKSSKKSGWKQGQSGSSEGTQEIPIYHLERLERIVYNQVIPILQTQFAYQRRKIDKARKPKEWAYTDIKQGLILLQRLNQKKKKTDLDDYADVLEKFIRRSMDKEESLMAKLYKLQQKLQAETQKNEILTKKYQRKGSEHEKVIDIQGLDKANKTTIHLYQNFVKETKALLRQGSSKDSSPRSLKVELNLLLSQIKNAVNPDEKGKICVHKEHRYQKQLHSGCKEEQSRSQQQIKNLKEVVNTLQKQAESLREECEVLEVKLRKSSQKLNKIDMKSMKLKEENEELIAKVEHLTDQNTYKNNLIADYLNIVSKLEEHVKTKEESFTFLQEQNERSNEVIQKKSQDYQQLLRHLQELEERNKELEEMEDKAHRDLEEVLQKNYVREFEVTHIATTLDRHMKEAESFKKLMAEKDDAIINLEHRNKQLMSDLQKQGICPSKETIYYKNAGVQVEADIFMHQYLLNPLNQLGQPTQDYNLLIQSSQMGKSPPQKRQMTDFMTQLREHQPQNLIDNIGNPFLQPNPLNQYVPPLTIGQITPSNSDMVPLLPNPFNQNMFMLPQTNPENQNQFSQPQDIHLHIPNVLNQLGKPSQNQNSRPVHQQSQNTDETPQFNPNVQLENQREGGEDIHNQFRKAIGEGYANFFNDINVRKSMDEGERGQSENKKEGNREDVQMLQQTIALLENGLKNTLAEVQNLKNQNQMLIFRNEQLLRSSQHRELLQNPFNLSIPNNSYNTAQQNFHQIQKQCREDFIPAHINKQVIQEVIRDLDQEKKVVDQRSHNLQQQISLLKRESEMIDGKKKQEPNGQWEEKEKREDWDAGHRYKEEDFQQMQEKERREDWDAGHRYRENDFEDNQEKQRREDWDAGHRYQQQIQDNQIIPYIPEQNNQIPPERPQQGEEANPQNSVINKSQKREESKSRRSSIQVPNMFEEFIQVKEPTVEELMKESNPSEEKKKGDVIGLQSEKGKNQVQLIRIDDRDQQARSAASDFAGIEDDRRSRTPEEKEEVKGSEQIQIPHELPPEVQQHYKLRQLLQITQKLKQKMIEVIEKKDDVNYQEEMLSFLKGVQTIENLLIICKKNTTKKVIRLKKIEGLRKEAEEEIQALQKKLETANQYFSNITSNEEGSILSFPDQIQEILRMKAPYGDVFKWTDENLDSKSKEMIDAQIQTDNIIQGFLESSVRRYFPADFKKFMSSQSLVNSLLNRSFIDELQNLTVEKLPNQEAMKRLESAFMNYEAIQKQEQFIPDTDEKVDPANTPFSKQSGEGSEDLKRSRVKMESEVRNLGTMIEFHKNRILHLHDLIMKKTQSSPPANNDLSLSTPLRRPILESQRYVNEITKAPKKRENQNILEKLQSSKHQEKDMQELQDMFRNREYEFQGIIMEKNEEVQRLKAIMKKITENTPREDRTSPKESRNKDIVNRQVEQLKGKFDELELALENQKTENEKLKLELKQQEFQQQMLKMKFRETYELQINSFREPDIDNNKAKSDNPKSDNPKSNQGKILQNIELNEEDKDEANSEKKDKQDKIQIISAQNQDRTLTEEKLKEELEKQKELQDEVKKVSNQDKQRAIKRFSRQSERPSKQSLSEPKGSNSQVHPDFGWTDMFPEYFGKKSKKN